MRIICLTRSLTVGGAERQIVGLAAMLRQKGHTVEVVTYHPQDFYAAYLEENCVEHRCILKKNGRQLEKDLTGHFRQWKPDVVIAFLVGPSLKACHIHRSWPNFKLIVSERNVNRCCLPHDIYRFLVFREADRVIANSHTQGDFVLRHAPWLKNKTGVIVNFTDTDRFIPADGKAANPRPVICTTARVNRRKNLTGYIKAAKILAGKGYDFDIRWYGLTEPDSYYRKCLEMIEKSGLSGRFHILEASRQVEKVYAESDFFCLPSFYEGTPNSMCEAIASGLPAACSAVSDNALYVRHGVNGETFNPGRPAEIAGALEKLLKLSTAERESYSRGSRQTALELLTKERFIRDYLNIISAILADSVR